MNNKRYCSIYRPKLKEVPDPITVKLFDFLNEYWLPFLVIVGLMFVVTIIGGR